MSTGPGGWSETCSTGRMFRFEFVAPQNVIVSWSLVIATLLEGASLQPHLCTGWPPAVRPNMESFDCVMQLEEPWSSQTRIDGEILKMYFDTQFMPKRQSRQGDDRKRSRLDLEQYRIRSPDSTFGWQTMGCTSPSIDEPEKSGTLGNALGDTGGHEVFYPLLKLPS